MRPKSPVLRYAFRAAAAKLRSRREDVTVNTLAAEMAANFKTVQRFLYRDKELASEIGVQLECVMHGVGEYAEVIVNIPSNRRPTVRRIASALGLDHSSVVRFVKAHPELEALHPRFETWRAEPESFITPEVRRWRDLGVAIWDHDLRRFVGVSASRAEYLNYWEKGLLKHQFENKPKPKHLPKPEEVEYMT